MKLKGVAFEAGKLRGGGAENIIKKNKKCLTNISPFSPTQNRNIHLAKNVGTSLPKVYTRIVDTGASHLYISPQALHGTINTAAPKIHI